MKVRISATIDEKTEKRIEDFLKNSKHRNKSHFIEDAIEEYLKKGEENVKKR
ncbi:MAG: ribbon-helix-helix domain-containing protein [Candidatus Pacearchaeota archaeon]|jgi:metal-responsive CopG/Arc/MetJ family transcriptional regulator